MTAMGQNRTSRLKAIYVCFLSLTRSYASECLLSGVKQTFEARPQRVRL